jgi:hypothetical protein
VNLVSTADLYRLITSKPGATAAESKGVMTDLPAKRDIAIVVGGGGDPISEFDAAKAMCEDASRSVATFVCNDMIALFPYPIDFAGTLHPDKMHVWIRLRTEHSYPMPLGSIWSHRSYKGFTHHTRDWQGSSGLLMTKIARECGYTHIILAGVPMTVDAEHFVRHQRWNAAPGFVRGWRRQEGILRPYVRSISGWTQETFGAPSIEWLVENIPDRNPCTFEPTPAVSPPDIPVRRPSIRA